MKKTLSVAVLFFIAPFAEAAKITYEDLTSAAKRQAVTVKAVAQGLSDDNLRCTITNKSKKNIHLRISPGLHFSSSDKEKQDLFTYQEKLLVLAPGASSMVRLSGFCMEKSDGSPSGNSVYALQGHAGKGLHPLGDSLFKYPKIATHYGQMFVWSVTDKTPLEDMHLSASLLQGGTNIMQHVSNLTGLPAGRVSQSGDTRPTLKTFSSSTTFDYHSPADQIASLKVYEANGQEFSTLFKDRNLGPGVVRYGVNINARIPVETNGLYYVRLIDKNGKVIQEMEVTENSPEKGPDPAELTFALDFTLEKPVKNAFLRVRKADGTLLEEIKKHTYIPAGRAIYQWSIFHLQPPGTELLVQLESETGQILKQLPVIVEVPPKKVTQQKRKRTR